MPSGFRMAYFFPHRSGVCRVRQQNMQDNSKLPARLPPLGPRLHMVAALVRPGGTVADIGTDHARLPVWLVLTGGCRDAVAADIRPGPLAAARRTVDEFAVADRVRLILSDGLGAVPPTDDVVIAGMGGELIASILAAGEWVRSSAVRLVLQPMTGEEELRRYLCRAGFAIRQEAAAREGRHLYAALAAEYDGRPWEPDALFCAAGNLTGRDGPVVRDYLLHKAAVLEKRAAGLRLSTGRRDEAEPLETLAAALCRRAET